MEQLDHIGDFILQVEWRYTPREPDYKKYNSGIFVRTSKYGELWYQAQAGLAGGYWFGDNVADGQVKRFNLMKQMKENRIKPAGEWNVFEITCKSQTVTLWVNGAVTAVWDACQVPKGLVGLEAEGSAIEFRNVKFKETR